MEVVDDIIIVPAETSAHFWMDRFIKYYKHGIDEGVVVKKGKITWTGDWCEHSIYLDKDRFIIDGNEVFINSELWNKYLKMRELCGAIYVRAPRKIAFPDDWSELSDDRVLENIHYLQKNYKKYKIELTADNNVKIDNVLICRDSKNVNGIDKICLTINNNTYCRDNAIGKELIDLMHVCKMSLVPFKDKASKWWKDNEEKAKYYIGGSMIFTLVIGVYIMGLYADKDTKQSKQEFKQEIIKEALDSLRKEQQKTVNYNDSINQHTR